MRIAQVAPLYEAVPPRAYGGTERVVSWLTEELVRLGHDVTLFASSDSQTGARLIGSQCALRLASVRDQLAPHMLMVERVAQMAVAGEFDVIHSHIDYLPFSLFRNFALPSVTTLHGRLDNAELVPIFQEFVDMPVVSISDAQRAPLGWANWQATVHHGLPLDCYSLTQQPQDYFLFLGRICPEKRLDRAIEIASRMGVRLLVGAKIDRNDADYYNREIAPLMNNNLVQFIGEVSEEQKNELIGGARALLFPIDWPEPFGLVMIEAMACGTPVIAFNCGSVAEIMVDGLTGFVCDSVDAAVDAARRLDQIDRRRCRAYFEERFCAPRMARDYLKVYESAARRKHDDKVIYMQGRLPKMADSGLRK